MGELTGTTPSTTIFLTDALGSVLTTFSNAAGTAKVLANQVYGPYGSQRYSSGTSMGTDKGFTGQYTDPFTGLDYYNARYYDPVVGMFLSADTVQGNPQGMNPYAYVGGNPETKTDPTGNMDCKVVSNGPASSNGCGGGLTGPPPPPGGGGPAPCHGDNHPWCNPNPPPSGGGGGNKPSPGPSRAKSVDDCVGDISCGGIKDRGMFVNGLFDAATGLGLMAALFALMSNPAIAGFKALTSSLWRSLLNQMGSWMLSGLHMILSSLDRPNPLLLVIVDVVKLAADVAVALYSITDIWELIQQGPGKTLLTKVDTFASDVLSFLKGGTGLLTIGMRALQSVGDVFLAVLGVDTLKSDWSTLETDIGAMQQMYNERR